jgi:hypothetical protein
MEHSMKPVNITSSTVVMLPIEPDHDDDSEDELVDLSLAGNFQLSRATTEEWYSNLIHTLREFCDGLEYQKQFNDHRMLDTVERESAMCLRLARSCLGKEHSFRSTRTSTPKTWDKSSMSALFYQPRPKAADIGT